MWDKSLNIILKDDTEVLDEVVITSYGGSLETRCFDYSNFEIGQ